MKRHRRGDSSGSSVLIGDLLKGALKKLGVKSDYEKAQLETECREWLGSNAREALADVSFKSGVVTMGFKSSVWLNEMNFRSEEGLKLLREKLPELRIVAVRFRLARERREKST